MFKNKIIFIKYVVVLVFVVFFNYAFAQNLIPNHGFEEQNLDSVANWKHPVGNYYHYEKLKIDTGLNHIYGICIWTSLYSEYIHVKLTQKLFKNQKYLISFDVKNSLLNDDCSTYLIYDFGILFTSDSLNVGQRLKLMSAPQFKFKIDNSDKKWIHLQKEYIANGDEEYVTVGYFFDNESVSDTLSSKKNDSIMAENDKYETDIIKLDTSKQKEIDFQVNVLKKKYLTYSLEDINNNFKGKQRKNELAKHKSQVSKINKELSEIVKIIDFTYKSQRKDM